MKNIMVNLPEMIQANEVKKPYNEMILSEDMKLSKPIIKYGVNPATGIPLSDDFMASMIHNIGSIGLPTSDAYDMVAVGERRKILVDLFFVRAEILFSNMVNTLNVRYNRELKHRFRDIHNKLSKLNYDTFCDSSDERFVYLFKTNMFSQDGYTMRYNLDNRIAETGRDRTRMSKLVDLEYYMRVPLGTILDRILPPIAADYRNNISNINNALITSHNLGIMAIDYDDFIQFISGCYINLLACAEAIVRLLYDEAMTMIESGYPNKYGIEYDEFLDTRMTAAKAAEAKLFADIAIDDLKTITE